jgi:N-acetylglucosamine-6-phosphate deacetylase
MIVLSGADLVLPDRILSRGTLVVDGDRVVEIRPDAPGGAAHGAPFAFHDHYILPGLIDVHVHGVDGFDSLGGPGSVRSIAARLPRYGVTAFCPTTLACSPDALRTVLAQVRDAREAPDPRSARVLPAHLESNFINPEFRGAQPIECLRSPRHALDRSAEAPRSATTGSASLSDERHRDFTAAEILNEIERAAPDVGIVTVAPELDGAIDLIGRLVARSHHVSLGHSGATFEQALAGIDAGARQATHLFNRMPPLDHRAPGLAGAVLQSDEVAAEVICDGFHVHPALVRMAIAAKRPARILAITDGTAAAGLPVGSRARIGGRTIEATETTALLEDGTIAGSVWTMDRVLRTLVGTVGLSLVDAATVCSTTPARELGLVGYGILAVDAMADLVVLDPQLNVVQTYVGGQLVYHRAAV